MIDHGLSPAFMAELTEVIRSTLGPELVGLYLYGSAVAGDFVPDVSDVDLVAVTGPDVADLDVDAIAAMHRSLVAAWPEWDDRVDVEYVGRATLARFREGGKLAVISPGEPFHVRDGAELWLQDWYLVRETGIRLIGPEPAALFPPVSWAEFVEATRQHADEVAEAGLDGMSAGARAYTVLTMCRAVCTIRSGRACSKQQGAGWVATRMPEWRDVTEEAVASRLARGGSGFADAASVARAEAFLVAAAASIRHSDDQPDR